MPDLLPSVWNTSLRKFQMNLVHGKSLQCYLTLSLIRVLQWYEQSTMAENEGIRKKESCRKESWKDRHYVFQV